MMESEVPATDGLGVTSKDISAVKRIRSREKLAGFLRSWWIPIASSAAGLVAGIAPMLALEEEHVASTYPYAAAMVSAVVANPTTSRRPATFLILLAVPVFLFAFMVGLAIGEIVNGESQFGTVTKYGVLK
jgi:hypothetical protein